MEAFRGADGGSQRFVWNTVYCCGDSDFTDASCVSAGLVYGGCLRKRPYRQRERCFKGDGRRGYDAGKMGIAPGILLSRAGWLSAQVGGDEDKVRVQIQGNTVFWGTADVSFSLEKEMKILRPVTFIRKAAAWKDGGD